MVRAILVGTLVVLLVGCGADEPAVELGQADDVATAAPAEAEGPVANACPADGCRVEIVDVASEGDELRLTWEANYLPDVSRNHVHVYWDRFSADQVSIDASDRGVEQGAWEVTDAYPAYVTEGAVSTVERDGSTTLCVTAADRNHAVLDGELYDCRDVADLLES